MEHTILSALCLDGFVTRNWGDFKLVVSGVSEMGGVKPGSGSSKG